MMYGGWDDGWRLVGRWMEDGWRNDGWRMDGWIDAWRVDGGMYGWMDGCMDGGLVEVWWRMDGGLMEDGWMDVRCVA